MSQYIVQGIFAVAGIISLLAAIFDWEWFFTARNTQFAVKSVGRKRARLFYGVLGVILIVNPEKPDVPLNKNDAFQKVQKRRVQEKR